MSAEPDPHRAHQVRVTTVLGSPGQLDLQTALANATQQNAFLFQLKKSLLDKLPHASAFHPAEARKRHSNVLVRKRQRSVPAGRHVITFRFSKKAIRKIRRHHLRRLKLVLQADYTPVGGTRQRTKKKITVRF
jgi:hypothetical protein